MKKTCIARKIDKQIKLKIHGTHTNTFNIQIYEVEKNQNV